MEKSMKKVLLFTVLFTIGLTLTVNSQVKRVLLEQHTGAWCGWCVDGTVKMDEILELYPDQVIGVKVHNGDKMVIPEQGIIAQGVGLTGYPSGTVDRKNFGGNIAQSRTVWKSYCESQMAQPAKVEVNVTYNLNESTRQLMVKVYANMIQTIYDPLRFNVIVMEDSVSGTGTGWDQSNYLSNRAGYEDNPYYNQPSKIVGYQHMKVVRTYLGGPWGIQGSFTKPANQGDVFTHEFSYTVPDEYKLHHLKVVGFVQVEAPSVKEILNCAYGVEGEASIELTSTGESKTVAAPGDAFEKVFTLKNISSSKKTFKLTSSMSERTPSDWTVGIEGASGETVELDPDGMVELSLMMTPGPTIGIGDATLVIEDTGDPNAFKGQGSVTVYSSKISNIEIIPAGEMAYSVSAALNSLGYDEFFPLNSADYNEMAPKFNRTNLIWNTGSAEGLLSEDVTAIVNAIRDKVPVFVCGNQSVYGLNSNSALPYFGATYNGYSTQGYGQAPWRVWFSGVENDPISGTLGNMLEGNLIKYLVTLLKITDSQKASPFLHFAYPGLHVVPNGNNRDTFDIKGEDAIFGIKVDDGTTRYALLSITPFVIVDQIKRNDMLDRIIKWINYDAVDVEEEITADDVFTVSPIPAVDFVTFNFNNAAAQRIEIYNNMGMLVDEINDMNSLNSYQYNASNLSSGVYTAVLHIGTVKTSTKFSIVR